MRMIKMTATRRILEPELKANKVRIHLKLTFTLSRGNSEFLFMLKRKNNYGSFVTFMHYLWAGSSNIWLCLSPAFGRVTTEKHL